MKRFHVHLHVDDLSRSIGFYSQLFAAQPARIEADYAKWMLEDPPVNFAVSTRGSKPGIDHLGIQTDDADELAALKARAQAADMALLDEGTTTCCYARSEALDYRPARRGLGALPHAGQHPRIQRSGARTWCRRGLLRGHAALEFLLLIRGTYDHRKPTTSCSSARAIRPDPSWPKASSTGGPRPLPCLLGGQSPQGCSPPLALATLERLHMPTADYRSKSWDEFVAPGAPEFDFIFTVCDNAAGEVCPVWPGRPMSAHWGVPTLRPSKVQRSSSARRSRMRH